MNISNFQHVSLIEAIKNLFKELNVPMNYVADEPTTAQEILKDTYKDNTTFALVDDVYFVGMIDDAAFENTKGLDASEIKSDYDGVLIFGITLHQRDNKLLPTRSQLAEISRAFNREFYYTPVVLVFKYKDDDTDYIAFANTERLKYKQEWREGEKAGKVSLLRDVDIANPHRGHLDIIKELKIPTTGTKKVDSFAKLYDYWQNVFSVSVLSKKFYQELSNWYFWAVNEVTFPNMPKLENFIGEGIKPNDAENKLKEAIVEHNAKNVIRLLTRLLFTWFIKEKGLIPNELFDLKSLQKDFLKEISPYHDENSLFVEGNKESIYYKAILQNLFFASLNCPIQADGLDTRERGFRGNESYGKHRGVDHLMRYEKHFKNPKHFLEMMNQNVPFLNGGLFECLDDKLNNIYIDGFSDQMTKGEYLVVPDYLFFGTDEKIDLSVQYGSKNKKYKEAAVKGLINILDSYKFTIAENTPIEEDVALDPELLGKVFENLLASYNPETKTTARKQTGSFYTPREIVNYMVDESLIAYLKNNFNNETDEEQLDKDLHQLFSYDTTEITTFDVITKNKLIKTLDACKILDPACGSGAFPMGILQKMVHVLQKLDPDNSIWQELQLQKALDETQEVFQLASKEEREGRLKEINDAFDENVNSPDYARKLFLIENCIYGVDIQPIATQISKLRFFISLVVDQKNTQDPTTNFGIRPLPNLETKFVTANTLIGIEKENNLFTTDSIKDLEKELKQVRHKLFNAKTPKTKRKYRQKDKELRDQIAVTLIAHNFPEGEAQKLASWDPYDQNAASPFFDSEWMFDIKDGFDVVIGNPPYIKERGNASFFEPVNNSSFGKLWHQGKMDFWFYFLHKAIDLAKKGNGEICYITSRYWLNSEGAKKLIKRVSENLSFINVVDIGKLKVFDAVAGHHMVSHFSNKKQDDFKYMKLSNNLSGIVSDENNNNVEITTLKNSSVFKSNYEIILGEDMFSLIKKCTNLGILYDVSQGVVEAADKISKKQLGGYNGSDFYVGQGVFVLTKDEVLNLKLSQNELNLLKPYVNPNDVFSYQLNTTNLKYLIYSDKTSKALISNNQDYTNLKNHLDYLQDYITSSNKPYGIHRARQEKYFENPKIIFKNMFAYPDFAYDDSKLYFGFSFSSIIQKDSNFGLKYLLAILNSSFANKWFYTFGKLRGVGVDIGVKKLRLFPVKKSSMEIQESISLLVDIESAAKLLFENLSIQNIIDSCIFNLYFPTHMQEREIDVIKYVEQDLESVMQGRDFEGLNDTEKEEVIAQLHQIWSDSDNEVIKRMAQFKEKSPDILKPILES